MPHIYSGELNVLKNERKTVMYTNGAATTDQHTIATTEISQKQS